MPLETAVVEKATIASGASLSNAVHLNGRVPGKIGMPAAWDAADLSFQWSADGVTYRDLYDTAGAEYVLPTAAGRGPSLPPADFSAINYLKVRSGTAGTPINQTAQRVVEVVLRSF